MLAVKVFQKDQAPLRLIAESVGISETCARAAVDSLTERGLLEKYTGIRGKHTGGGYFMTSNTYMTGGGEVQVIDMADVASDCWEIGGKLTWKKLMNYYAAMLTAMLGGKLSKYVGRREAAEIRSNL